ncbi:hypothetical protein PIB30_010041 [Stylosanthes scabra]|uniref:Uncharacterized protein n=1 Tax=Stylosanthes scabra TaxID=79078 RepID=A0ABU6W757_9FABA|nr:hypothetical protein [Stylosanthes scabra]
MVEVEDRRFDVKEFGTEVYNRETHPNEQELAVMAGLDECSKTESRVMETPLDNATSLPETVEREISNCNVVANFSTIEKGTTIINDDRSDAGGLVGEYKENGCGVQTNNGPINSNSDSCPFSPGFGPWTSSTHVHKALVKELRVVEIEVGFGVEERTGESPDGISFKCNNEDELLARIVGDRMPKKRKSRGGGQSKKHVYQNPKVRFQNQIKMKLIIWNVKGLGVW